MYCQKCGAEIEDGARFCMRCGAKIGMTGPEEPVYSKPIYQQPICQQPVYQQPVCQQPVYSKPIYRQTVYQQPAAATPKKRRALIVPAILAIVSATVCLLLWIVFIISAARNLSRDIGYYSYSAYSGYLAIRDSIILILSFAASVFLTLYCLIQYKKGKTSLLGVCCLLLGILYVIYVLSYPASAILIKGSSFTVVQVIYILFDSAVIAMLTICMIGAFKGKLNRNILIIAAALILLLQLISTVHTCILNQNIKNIVTQGIYFLLNALLPAALLLTAILQKPVKTDAVSSDRPY